MNEDACEKARFSPACAGNGTPLCRRRLRHAVQPRVCGERRPRLHQTLLLLGSAPRVRGTGIAERLPSLCGRFSPACAGNGVIELHLLIKRTVQPRVCGERSGPFLPARTRYGSAPRVRGTGLLRDDGGIDNWFSPACAGNGAAPRVREVFQTVQPRVCGERKWRTFSMSGDSGSAPRVRGTVASGGRRAVVGRFSPACAGNGTVTPRGTSAPSVQPRVCGERSVTSMAPSSTSGSAPRVRGTAPWRCLRRTSRRFSPACAGNGRAACRSSRARPVQPRVCGERKQAVVIHDQLSGSAPRVRGTVNVYVGMTRDERFSPACAGNGKPGPHQCGPRSVQPRVCGERENSKSNAPPPDGSAPRVRGTDRPQETRGPSLRFSPACAGNGDQVGFTHVLRPVQPRVCGERRGALSWPRSQCGSAPRVRGTGQNSPCLARRTGFSPACAGNG